LEIKSAISQAIKNQIEYIGDNPEREGLVDTPERVIKSWSKLYGGYKEIPEEILKTTFIEGKCDEMVILKDIEFYSTCEHHILPFFGKVHIGYIPKDKVVGVSKLARLVECFARRLQIQERMTSEIADNINKVLDCEGVMVIVEAQHFCMTSRGVEKQRAKMITSAMRGNYERVEVRNEFLSLIK